MLNAKNAIGKMLGKSYLCKDMYSKNKTKMPQTDKEALPHLTPSGQALYKKMRKAGHPVNYAFDAALSGIDLVEE